MPSSITITNSSSESSNTTTPSTSTTTTIIYITLTATATLLLSTLYHKSRFAALSDKLTEQRLAERRGRIRAEVKLRTALKEQQQQQQQSSSSNSSNSNNDTPNDNNTTTTTLTMTSIGTIRTPYPKRMGTPRQSQLVPHSRGTISLSIPLSTVDGLEEYSHCWIFFGFHANTDVPWFSFSSQKKCKIRPPRAEGRRKVGMLATRSPHRPNALGLSLVRVTGINHKDKAVTVEGVDIVDGSPVYDIKPCVPWDIPGRFDQSTLTVPPWVDNCDDTIPHVTMTPTSLRSFRRSFAAGDFEPLYNPSRNQNDDDDDDDDDDADAAWHATSQVLAQDPRASNRRGTSSEEPYKLWFGGVEVSFVVTMGEDDEEGGQSRRREVTVVNVEKSDIEEMGVADGVPLATEGIVER